MAPILQMTFLSHALHRMTIVANGLFFTLYDFPVYKSWNNIFQSGFGLAPSTRQTTAWNNVDEIHCPRRVYSGPHALNVQTEIVRDHSPVLVENCQYGMSPGVKFGGIVLGPFRSWQVNIVSLWMGHISVRPLNALRRFRWKVWYQDIISSNIRHTTTMPHHLASLWREYR